MSWNFYWKLQKGKIRRYKRTNDTRLWRRPLIILMLKHKCFFNVGNLTCRKSSRSGVIKFFIGPCEDDNSEGLDHCRAGTLDPAMKEPGKHMVISLEGSLETDEWPEDKLIRWLVEGKWRSFVFSLPSSLHWRENKKPQKDSKCLKLSSAFTAEGYCTCTKKGVKSYTGNKTLQLFTGKGGFVFYFPHWVLFLARMLASPENVQVLKTTL